MGKDLRNHLLMQIDIRRCLICREELSKRLGNATEHCPARNIAGKRHQCADEFEKIAKALTIDARILAQEWAPSRSLRLPDEDAVNRMVDRAYRHWRRNSRLIARRASPSPSPMTVLCAKYADCHPRETPALWFNSFGCKKSPVRGPSTIRPRLKNVGRVCPRQTVTAQCTASMAYLMQLMRRAA